MQVIAIKVFCSYFSSVLSKACLDGAVLCSQFGQCSRSTHFCSSQCVKSVFVCSPDRSSGEEGSAVVRKKKAAATNPMIQKVCRDFIMLHEIYIICLLRSCCVHWSRNQQLHTAQPALQTKKVEKEEVSSSESEEEKEDKSVTVSYKSTRSAVSLISVVHDSYVIIWFIL